MRARNGESVLARAVRIFEAFAPDGPSLTVSEISRRTGLPLRPASHQRGGDRAHAPHTPGALSLHDPDLGSVFTDDTLTVGCPGATDRSFSHFPTINHVEATHRYVHMADEDPGWANALTREDPAMAPPAEDERAVELLNTVEELRARQARGEIRPDIDVGALSLVFFAAWIAPVVLPWIAREFTQQDPTSQEFVDDYADQLARIVAALDNVAGDEAPAAEPPGESGS